MLDCPCVNDIVIGVLLMACRLEGILLRPRSGSKKVSKLPPQGHSKFSTK
jgi:hypothetical protein